MENLGLALVKSWADKNGSVNSKAEIQQWIDYHLNNTYVKIEKTSLDKTVWHYDEKDGSIHNESRSFFSIFGIQKKDKDVLIQEQPIIVQPEIGYLGIICKEINGVLNFLMQAKIEPGNVNKIQISPTIQATKSNFTQKHGGKTPKYFEYIQEVYKYQIICDQIQSEQSSRFYKKRNRNIIILIKEEILVLTQFMWMTLGQIKDLMRLDNIVNMDTRTVLSCLPFSFYGIDEIKEDIESLFTDKALYHSIYKTVETNMISKIYNYVNTWKMANDANFNLVPLYSLTDWEYVNNEFICRTGYPFKIVFCNIEIEDREVDSWSQPLFEATVQGIFGLFTCTNDIGERQFLIHAIHEIGCFDLMEIGPSIQIDEVSHYKSKIEILFFEKLSNNSGIKYDVILSEEDGRFYQEQNRNVIIEIDKKELLGLTDGFFWVDYRTLNLLTQINNCLNIQLRNLLSLLEV